MPMWQSKAIRAAALSEPSGVRPPCKWLRSMAISGLGFSGANLLLARFLPTHDYARPALALSLVTLAVPLAPLGLQGVVVRQRLAATPQLLFRGMMTGIACGLAVAAVARFVYHFTWRIWRSSGSRSPAVVSRTWPQLCFQRRSDSRYRLYCLKVRTASCFWVRSSRASSSLTQACHLPSSCSARSSWQSWGWQKLIGENRGGSFRPAILLDRSAPLDKRRRGRGADAPD